MKNLIIGVTLTIISTTMAFAATSSATCPTGASLHGTSTPSGWFQKGNIIVKPHNQILLAKITLSEPNSKTLPKAYKMVACEYYIYTYTKHHDNGATSTQAKHTSSFQLSQNHQKACLVPNKPGYWFYPKYKISASTALKSGQSIQQVVCGSSNCSWQQNCSNTTSLLDRVKQFFKS